MHRREFIGGAPLLLLGTLDASACPSQSQAAPGPDLREELSAAEIEAVNASAMAGDLDNFYGKGFS